jgi:hypothetical protein
MHTFKLTKNDIAYLKLLIDILTFNDSNEREEGENVSDNQGYNSKSSRSKNLKIHD